MATISFEARPKSGADVKLNVPQEVVEDMEAAWKYLNENPEKEGIIQETSEETFQLYIRQAKRHLSTREDGAVKIRIMPRSENDKAQFRGRFRLRPGTDNTADDTALPAT